MRHTAYYGKHLICLYRLADVITTPLPGVHKSDLIPTEEPVTNQWQMDITWMPTTSEAGPTTSVFCFYARDTAGFVVICIVINYHHNNSIKQKHLQCLAYNLPLFQYTACMHAVNLLDFPYESYFTGEDHASVIMSD